MVRARSAGTLEVTGALAAAGDGRDAGFLRSADEAGSAVGIGRAGGGATLARAVAGVQTAAWRPRLRRSHGVAGAARAACAGAGAGGVAAGGVHEELPHRIGVAAGAAAGRVEARVGAAAVAKGIRARAGAGAGATRADLAGGAGTATDAAVGRIGGQCDADAGADGLVGRAGGRRCLHPPAERCQADAAGVCAYQATQHRAAVQAARRGLSCHHIQPLCHRLLVSCGASFVFELAGYVAV